MNRPGVEVRCRERYIASPDPKPLSERNELVRRRRLEPGAAPAFTMIISAADISFEEAGSTRLAELNAIISQRAVSGRELA